MPRNQYTQWPKSVVTWRRGETLCISVVFSWQLEQALARAHEHHKKTGGPVEIGGPAIDMVRLRVVDLVSSVDAFQPGRWGPWLSFPKRPRAECRGRVGTVDVVEMMNPLATFTSRGCPNSCSFCAVPLTEGAFRELRRWRPAPIICDNNLLASSKKHFSRVIESMRRFDRTDFNQGLDCRLFTSWHAGKIAELRNPKVRFAFDCAAIESDLMDAIDTALRAGIPRRRIGVYVLVGFYDDLTEALCRLEKVRSLKIRPNPMRYQPLLTPKKNSFVAPGWSERKLRDVMRYYSGLRWFGHIPFEEYRNTTMKGTA